MTKSQRIIVVLFAVLGFSGPGTAIQVKSIMDESSVVEPVVRITETRERFIERINREDLNSMYYRVPIPNGEP